MAVGVGVDDDEYGGTLVEAGPFGRLFTFGESYSLRCSSCASHGYVSFCLV